MIALVQSPAAEFKRPWYAPKSFRTKFIMVVGAAVVFDLLLSGGVALWNVSRLGQDASAEIRSGLEQANNEYLENYIETTALRANAMLGQVKSEVTVLASAMQTSLDHPEASSPGPTPPLVYNAKNNWSQNTSGVSVLSVWGYLLNDAKQPTPATLRQIEQSAALDLMGASLMSSGAGKLQMYYMGPKDCPIMRTTPYSAQAETFDKLYPGHNDKNFWDFFFPGVYETWQDWIRHPERRPASGYITGTMPYIDAITGNLIITYFHPLWNRDRTDCAGAVAVDITLDQLSELGTGVHLARTGFGFIARDGGNVLAISPAGQKTLGLEMTNRGGSGVTALDRQLDKSIHPAIAKLALPASDKVVKQHVTLMQNGHRENYFIALRRLQGSNRWVDGKVGFDHTILGFVVPEREIYASLYGAQDKMAAAVGRIRDGQLCILVISLGVVMLAVLGISRRITSGLTALAGAARRMEKNDFTVRVNIPTHDEVGELAHAFNSMTTEIESYTLRLEEKVEERTRKLGAANEEIQKLNEQLKSENLRMGAELDIAQRLQKMVLPRPEELQAVPKLDIAAHMEPAGEVGGDYYDVLQSGGRVKIGIGDVTGHGLESGVLMLMVQAMARALVENGETDPKRFLAVLNQVLVKNIARTGSGNNLSLSYLDYAEGNVTLTGQHEEVIVVRQSGALERINTMDLGFPVGLESDISPFLASLALQLESGDAVILFTDGITEAENRAGELYRIERLCESAQRWHEGTAAEIRQGIVEDVMRHVDGQALLDDITLVVLKQN